MAKTTKKEYYRMVGTAATHAIFTLNQDIDKNQNPLVLKYDDKKVEIHTSSETPIRLGFSAKKLFDYILLLLANRNNLGDCPSDKVWFTLEDYMHIMDYTQSRQMHHKCFNLVCEDVAKLGTVMLRQESATWSRLLEDQCRFVSSRGAKHDQKDIVAGRACFEVGVHPELQKHIKRDGNIVPFSGELFRLVGRNENAYALAKRMIWNFGTEITEHKKHRLKVSTLLACCPDRSSQYTGDTRRMFGQALDLLASTDGADGPLIRWNYVLKGKLHSTAEISAMKLRQNDWLNAIVKFKPIGLSSKMNFADPSSLSSTTKRVLVNDEDEEIGDGMDISTYLACFGSLTNDTQ